MKVEIAFFYAISTFIDWFLVKKMYLCNEKNDNNSYCMKQLENFVKTDPR